MAGSKLEKLGSIFTRIQGLLRSGALKYDDKPLWYEVYKRFPPKTNPIYNRDVPKGRVRTLLYSEDLIRARFFNEFSHNPDVFHLTDENKTLVISQRFMQKYRQIKTDNLSEDVAFNMARDALKVEGIALKTTDDILKEETQRLKEEAKRRMAREKFVGVAARKRPTTASELFGDAATKSRDDDGDAFIDEEFFDLADMERAEEESLGDRKDSEHRVSHKAVKSKHVKP